MGIRFLLGIAVFALGACEPRHDRDNVVHVDLLEQPFGKTPSGAYLNPVDRKIAETGKGIPGRPFPCARRATASDGLIGEGEHYVRLKTEECVLMTPPKRWRGRWIVGFETSAFCPVEASSCGLEGAWLSWREPEGNEHYAPHKEGFVAYDIDFIGRRTKYEADYGHLGGSPHEMVVDRMISIGRVRD